MTAGGPGKNEEKWESKHAPSVLRKKIRNNLGKAQVSGHNRAEINLK